MKTVTFTVPISRPSLLTEKEIMRYTSIPKTAAMEPRQWWIVESGMATILFATYKEASECARDRIGARVIRVQEVDVQEPKNEQSEGDLLT